MITDLAYYVFIMMFVAIGLLVAYVFADNLNAAIQDIPTLNSTVKATYSSTYSRFPTVFDWMFLAGFLAGWLGIIALVWFLDINPIAFFAVLMVLVLLAGLAGYLANAFILATTGGTLGAASLGLPVTTFIMQNYLVVDLLVFFSVMVVFFAKPRGGGL